MFTKPEAVTPGAPVGLVFYVDSQPMALAANVKLGKPFTMTTADKNAGLLEPGKRTMLILQEGNQFAKAEAQVVACAQDGDNWTIEAGDFGWEEVDRRRYPRYELELDVKLKAVTETEGQAELRYFEAKTVDVSLGGAWVQTDHKLPAGSLVEFQAELTPGHTVRVLGIIAWSVSEKEGLGIEFLDFIGGSRYQLHMFLTHNAA